MAVARKNQEKTLTQQQRLFIDYYVAGPDDVRGNMAASYRKAYPKVQYIGARPTRLLQEPQAAQYLEERRRAMTERTDIDAARVMKELAKIGFSDIRSLFDEHGRLKPIHDLPPAISATIASIDVIVKDDKESKTPLQIHKIKLWNKLDALDKMGKQIGMFREQKDVHVKGEITHLLEEISGAPLSTPMGRVQAAIDGALPDYDDDTSESGE